MDFWTGLLSSKVPKQEKQGGRDHSPRLSSSTTAGMSRSCPPTNRESSVDESVPPTIEYAFSRDEIGQQLLVQWQSFEEAFADARLSVEDKADVLLPFAMTFMAAFEPPLAGTEKTQTKEKQADGKHQEGTPKAQIEGPQEGFKTAETKRMALVEQRGEGGAPERASGKASHTAYPGLATLVPPTFRDAEGHPKLVTVLLCSILVDLLAAPPPASPSPGAGRTEPTPPFNPSLPIAVSPSSPPPPDHWRDYELGTMPRPT